MKTRRQPDPLPADAILAAALAATAPLALGGVSLRSRPGHQREAWLTWFHGLLPHDVPRARLPLQIGDDRLLGGLDLAATLQSGRPTVQRGLLADCDGGILTIPIAERTPAALAGKLAAVVDSGAIDLERDGLAARFPSAFGVILLDEGLAEDETPPACLLDRLAFHLRMEPQAGAETMPSGLGTLTSGDIATAQRRLPAVAAGDDVIEALCAASLALGIDSARAARFALTAARASAALFARDRVGEEDAALAARLVLAPRASQLPAEEPPAEAEDPEPSRHRSDSDGAKPPGQDRAGAKPEALEDVVLAATKAAIPPDLLAHLMAGENRRSRDSGGGRAGPLKATTTRGRPVGARRGAPKPGQRLNLLDTLRAAAPWQTIRRRELGDRPQALAPRVLIRREDFRITRYKHHPETTTIFVVDASGSAALHRLAEAKGAVELLLADCYIRRDSVALLTFRGRSADLLLPPTRSLARVKRCLAGFPAGGGTPLAAAIDAAAALAEGLRRKGQSPVAVFLTDGRGNIARDGSADREAAESDTRAAASALAASGLASLLVDISPRPRPIGRQLAEKMRATYLALPRADAAALCSAVQAHANVTR